MSKSKLVDEIITIVNSVANNNPPSELARVTKSYDGNYVDVVFDNGGNLNYVPSNVRGSVGDVGVIVYLNGNINNPFVILSGKGGDSPVSEEYVKKNEVDIVLMDNGYFKLKLDNRVE